MDFTQKATEVDDSTFSEVFKIIGGRQSGSGLTTDSDRPISMSPDDITQIQAITLSKVRENMAIDGVFQDLSEARKYVAIDVSKLTTDAFFNNVNGIGTLADPGYYNTANTPVSMTPMEITSYYSSGGVPAAIIDIKAGGMLTNGYRFLGNGWSPDDLERLKEYADSLNFDQHLRDGNRDGLSFGGAMVVPHLKKDNASTYPLSIEELLKKQILTKDSITRFWEADRWNCVLVPDYNIAASDYLDPKRIFVPIAGVNVRTERTALIRPKQLPYWGTIRQMGWGVSEMEAWIRALLGWELSIAALPIMIQQMSVMYAHMPLDANLASLGANAVQAVAEKVQKQLVQMSNVAPKTINSTWELKALERNFTGFNELVKVQERAVSAKAELSDAIIFNREETGRNGDGETTLKLAGSIQKVANRIIPQVQPLIKMMIISCFGPNSEQAEKAHLVRIDFDSPVVLTNEERNQAGATFSAVVTAAYGLGLQPVDALEIGKAFIPDIELPQDVLDKLKAIPDDLGESSPAIEALSERLKPHGIENLAASLRQENGIPNLAEKLTKPKGSGIRGLFRRLMGGNK